MTGKNKNFSFVSVLGIVNLGLVKKWKVVLLSKMKSNDFRRRSH